MFPGEVDDELRERLAPDAFVLLVARVPVTLSDKGYRNAGGHITTPCRGGAGGVAESRQPSPRQAAVSHGSLILMVKPAFERRPADHSPHGLSVAPGDAILLRQVIA